MRTKKKVALIAIAMMVFAVAAYLLLGPNRPTNNALSLTFQRYSNLDPYVWDDVAFLDLTNSSSKSCLLFMTGNTNTHILDTSFGQFKQSWMVNCAFSDETSNGRTNWIQQASGSGIAISPHSAVVVRVPRPPHGQSRRVAVLYQPSGWRQSKFWGTPFGRTLPRGAFLRLFREPVLKAWCDRELTSPD
jgi:hypothetical protein